MLKRQRRLFCSGSGAKSVGVNDLCCDSQSPSRAAVFAATSVNFISASRTAATAFR